MLQVLEFDLRSCGGARALLVTSPATVFDDGEVRRSALEDRRATFRTRSRTPCQLLHPHYCQAGFASAEPSRCVDLHADHHRVLHRPSLREVVAVPHSSKIAFRIAASVVLL